MGLRRVLSRYVRRSVRFPGYRFRSRKRFLTVRMDTTNVCNLRCGMCPMTLSDRDPDRRWHHMDPKLFDRLEREIFPIAHTVGLSCGAEPFCNPDFAYFLERLWKSDVPVREVVTNGTLLQEKNIALLLETPPTSLFVSIDGATPETHAIIRGGADLDSIIESLGLMMKARSASGAVFPMLSFSTTLQKRNSSELTDIVRLAASVGAASVGVVPLVPYEGLATGGEVVDLTESSVRLSVESAETLASELGILFNVSRGPEKKPGKACAYLDDWVYIDPDGRVNPCPYWNTAAPMGNLNESSFVDIWNGMEYGELRMRLGSGQLTGNCSLCPEMDGAVSADIPKI